ncbi:MAG: right-handed parallel beta-helix repeat-containing protein, partial [Actinomycetota bacterium]|nr:right-handed parallel beta-helix repeat-containing protein [Actinomycetota bacterium]
MTSSYVPRVLGLALMLVLGACAQVEGGDTAREDSFVFPAALVAAGAEAPNTVTSTTVPRLSEEPAPVLPPPPRVAAEAIQPNARPLPLPSSALLPDVGMIVPSVVTAAGERRVLQEVSVSVAYDPETGFVVEPAGWWVINYPLDRIVGAEGRTLDEISGALLGRPLAEITNYYFYTAPAAGADVLEPAPAADPAPIAITPAPDLVVNNLHPGASDDNVGSPAHPLLTISEAVSRAEEGTVVHVYPGTYRESVAVTADGTANDPIRIEGIRGAAGGMPVITGNDPFPADAWQEVDGLPGVYRADPVADLPGTVSIDGQAMVERSAPWDLSPGEFVVTTGSDPYVDPRFDGDVRAKEGTVFTFDQSQYIWEPKQTDGGGFVDLGSDFGEDFAGGVYWGSAWVWVERPTSAEDYEWFGTNDFGLQASGPFRAGEITGAPLPEQPYEYRVWLDGELLAGGIRDDAGNGEADLPHPELGLGDFGEVWHGVVMRQGWHHLVFQWDTTTAPGADAAAPLFRFGVPEVIGNAVTSAAKPSNLRRAGSGQAQAYLSEYMVLGPIPSSYEPSVYVRLPDTENPNGVDLDMAARSGSVVSILGDFVELRGFDIRHGAQAEGQSLLTVGQRTDDPAEDALVQGVVIEGNLIVGSEYGGIDVPVEGDQGVAPITVRNNWVIDSGAIGISAQGSSSRLTTATLNDWAPGRTKVVVENNTIVNSGWAGYARQDDVGGIVFERMAGSSIQYNTITGGGPGITLKGDNYGIRVDGNRIVDPWGWGIGIEANPGPNVIANNVVTGLRNGPEWIKAHLLTWDSDQTWIINNTTDGEWGVDTGWYGDIGSWGAAGPENFNRLEFDTWDMTMFRRSYINNLLLGSYLGGIEDYLGNWGEIDTFTSNLRALNLSTQNSFKPVINEEELATCDLVILNFP